MMSPKDFVFIRTFEIKTFDHVLICDFYVEKEGVAGDIRIYTDFKEKNIYLGHTNPVRFEDHLQIFFETLEEEHHPEELKDWSRGELEPFVGLFDLTRGPRDDGYEGMGSPMTLFQCNFSMTELKVSVSEITGKDLGFRDRRLIKRY
mgnify:CR=1 FL=1